MTQVFVSGIDKPVGHAIAHLISHTQVGSRISADPEESDQIQKDFYTVVGSLSSSISDVAAYNEKRNPISRKGVESFERVKAGASSSWVKTTIEQNADRSEKLKQVWKESQVVIIDLLSDIQEADDALQFLLDMNDQDASGKKTVVLVSTVMTWAKTTSEDVSAWSEEDFRKRKAHPAYKQHLSVERKVSLLDKKRPHWKTYLVWAGLIYHLNEGLCHNLFKHAWDGKQLVCYDGKEDTSLPLIYLNDLANIVVEMVEVLPNQRLLIAMDDSKTSYYQMLKAISSRFSSGRVKRMAKEEALVQDAIPLEDINQLQFNVPFEPLALQNLNLPLQIDNFVDQIERLGDEYVKFHGLDPINLLVHGPPYCGKTTLAKRIAHVYRLELVQLESLVKLLTEDRVLDIADFEEDDIEAIKQEEDLRQQRKNELLDYAASHAGEYPEDLILDMLKETLKSPAVKNHGYVLDGYPESLEQSKRLFSEDDTDIPWPQFLISLELRDDTIKYRAMNIPESEVIPGKTNEEGILKRIQAFHSNNNDEKTPLDLFAEKDVFPREIPADKYDAESLYQDVADYIGKPHHFGMSAEEKAEEERKLKEWQEKVQREQDEIVQKTKQAEEERLKVQREANEKKQAELRRQEEEALRVQSLPLRTYLMENVMPTLNKALIEICNVRPDDPVDYLAEYLFRHHKEADTRTESRDSPIASV